MSIQILNGITVTPKQGSILGRFSASAGVSPVRLWPWPTSYAFGGWIYSANCSIGFGQKPTEITLYMTLESPSSLSQKAANFDILDTDLRCDAGDGGPINENLYDINFNGVFYSDMVLFSYKKDIQSNRKILSVVFKDYSVLLDKIYVGLIKRQGNKFLHSSFASGQIPAKCPDCTLTGGFFPYTGQLVRELAYGSYVGLNEKTEDNFSSVTNSALENIFKNWTNFIEKSQNFSYSNKFDLNGGYLMLGTEEMPEENCGALPEVKYSFAELIASLKLRGLKFDGVFPTGYSERIYGYRQNYIGTLREVLGNWCSDFAMDYYCSGRTFIGLDISKSINVKGLFDLPDSAKDISRPFIANAAAINTYSEAASLEDAYSQGIITANIRAIEHKTESKDVKRYVGMYPLHPIDLNYFNMSNQVVRNDIFGFGYLDYVYQWDFDTLGSIITYNGSIGGVQAASFTKGSDRAQRFQKFTNRTFGDIDTCMALSKFNKTLRDIFVGERILESLAILDVSASNTIESTRNAKKDFDSNFKALGFAPIVRLENEEIKSYLISKFKGGGNDAATQSIVLDQSFYQIFLGYYYSDFHEEVISWENSCAENMYKFVRVQQGTLQGTPYVPSDILYDASPAGGFEYGSSGLSFTTYKNEFEPSAQQYPSVRFAPFVDLIPYTGLAEKVLFKDIGYTGYVPIVGPTGFYYASIDNAWGTTPDNFNKALEFNDQSCQSYTTASAINQLQDLDGFTEQQWDLDNFKPSFHPDLDEFYREFQSQIEEIAATTNGALSADQISTVYYNYQGIYKNICPKLHVCIIPDVRASRHPNCTVVFEVSGFKTKNPVMWEKFLEDEKEALKRRTQEKKPSICDLHPLDEICNDGLKFKAATAQNKDLHDYSCDPNPTGIYRAGFSREMLDSPNSRGLVVSVGRNTRISPNNQFAPTDELGYFYVSDLSESLLTYPAAYRNAAIIYPVNCNPYFASLSMLSGQSPANTQMYSGIMTTHIETELRVPEVTEIYGEPPNKKNNNTSRLKIINNTIDPDLNPYLSINGKGFLHFTTLLTGANNAITTVSEYHSVISALNRNESPDIKQTVDVKLIGSPDMFGSFLSAINPLSGLTNFNITLDDNGVSTDLSFSSRPPTLPNQESILNKIGPRLIR
jgi:hypothetical protein